MIDLKCISCGNTEFEKKSYYKFHKANGEVITTILRQEIKCVVCKRTYPRASELI